MAGLDKRGVSELFRHQPAQREQAPFQAQQEQGQSHQHPDEAQQDLAEIRRLLAQHQNWKPKMMAAMGSTSVTVPRVTSTMAGEHVHQISIP